MLCTAYVTSLASIDRSDSLYPLNLKEVRGSIFVLPEVIGSNIQRNEHYPTTPDIWVAELNTAVKAAMKELVTNHLIHGVKFSDAVYLAAYTLMYSANTSQNPIEVITDPVAVVKMSLYSLLGYGLYIFFSRACEKSICLGHVTSCSASS